MLDMVEGAADAETFDPDRFELLIGMLFGLAKDGLADKKGRPFPLQAAVVAKEFADVVVFTHPPAAVQRVVLAILAPIARFAGYRAIVPAYCKPHARVAALPEVLAAARLLTT